MNDSAHCIHYFHISVAPLEEPPSTIPLATVEATYRGLGDGDQREALCL